MKTKNLLTLLLILGFSSSLVACDPAETSRSESVSVEESVDNSEISSDTIVDNGEYVYEGTPTVAPYVVYNEDGTEYV